MDRSISILPPSRNILHSPFRHSHPPHTALPLLHQPDQAILLRKPTLRGTRGWYSWCYREPRRGRSRAHVRGWGETASAAVYVFKCLEWTGESVQRRRAGCFRQGADGEYCEECIDEYATPSRSNTITILTVIDVSQIATYVIPTKRTGSCN